MNKQIMYMVIALLACNVVVASDMIGLPLMLKQNGVLVEDANLRVRVYSDSSCAVQIYSEDFTDPFSGGYAYVKLGETANTLNLTMNEYYYCKFWVNSVAIGGCYQKCFQAPVGRIGSFEQVYTYDSVTSGTNWLRYGRLSLNRADYPQVQFSNDAWVTYWNTGIYNGDSTRGGYQIQYTPNTPSIYIANGTTGVYPNVVGINTISPSKDYAFDINGNLYVNGNIKLAGTFNASSPLMYGKDEEKGYTTFCVWDKLGYQNLLYYEAGKLVIETNSDYCNNKQAKIDKVEELRAVRTMVQNKPTDAPVLVGYQDVVVEDGKAEVIPGTVTTTKPTKIIIN